MCCREISFSLFSLARETRLCGGETVFRLLLQPEESEGGVHLSSSGPEGPSEGTSKTDITFSREERKLGPLGGLPVSSLSMERIHFTN